MTNFESRTENRQNELKTEYTQQYKELKQEIDFLKQRLPEKIEPLATFNEASLIELSSKLRLAISANKASNIAPLIVKQRPFESLNEISEKVKGLGTIALLKIVDRWLYSQ